ncbi:uncharacterized protein METZ01_LOCUS252426 [marine metagenome]|uniref:Uncharacterized protein n=1 Tax=marine metagenome TaxID=408172 RepID=A0A382IJZ5_9ZZZZ
MLLWFYKWITRGLPFSGQLQANDKAYRLEPICTQGLYYAEVFPR